VEFDDPDPRTNQLISMYTWQVGGLIGRTGLIGSPYRNVSLMDLRIRREAFSWLTWLVDDDMI
jgi:hypothetical protein